MLKSVVYPVAASVRGEREGECQSARVTACRKEECSCMPFIFLHIGGHFVSIRAYMWVISCHVFLCMRACGCRVHIYES